MTSFEVNTDIEFINPDWDVFSDLHDHRYGLAIQYIKDVVEGESFDNDVMDLKVSGDGFYAQSKNFPAAFYGDTGEFSYEFLDDAEVQAVLFDAVALYRAGDARSITCVYSDNAPGDVFFGYRYNAEERYELGFMRATTPLHLRVMIDAEEETELLAHNKGVLMYQRTDEGRHLLIRAPGRRQPFPLLDGFAE